ncbi:hypothetical protein M378DRAFT_18838, partial [Amanita muscaria Koide BX008]
IGVKTPNTLRVDEKSFIEDFFQTYLDPSIVDVRRPIKYGLDVLPALSVTASPTSIPLKHLNTPNELSIIPRTLLLPSTPAFEDSLSISYDGLPSPSTPSTTCSTPPLSPRTLDTSVASLDAAHTVTIDDFHLLQFLSKGGWGQVYLAKHTVSNRRLALKVMNREQKLFGHPVVKQLLIQERKIMESLQGCDWFVQLEASWCDSNNLYIAMAYYPTDLESEIIRCETLPETRARFYMAEIIIALEELHKRGIVHRDIKTGNILIRADGHIVLADFGLSKDFGARPTLAERSYQPYWPFKADDDASVVSPRKPTELFFVTREMLGSEPEMAPEIIMEDHYSFGVDFWSAGVTLYVMLTGIHPWSDGDEKSLQLQILEDEIEFYEEDEISEECQDFIRQMLQKEPTERLRIGEDMTSHPFFAGVDWVAMRNRTVSPPWVPDFVSGHHFFPTWESLEMFEPGLPVDEDEDEFKDFLFTSAELEQCVETPLEDFFKYSAEDEDEVDDDEEPHNSDIEDQCMPDMVVCPYDRAEVCFPAVAASVSHTSLAASFHSTPSFLQFMNAERSVESILEIAAPSTQPMYFVTKPVPAKIAEHVISGCEWRVAEPTLPANVKLPEFVNNKAISLSFRCNMETVAAPVMVPFHHTPYVRSNNDARPSGCGFLSGIASWFKGFSPCSTRNIEVSDGWTNAEDLTIWGRFKRRFRNLLVREAKYGQGHQLRGPDLC